MCRTRGGFSNHSQLLVKNRCRAKNAKVAKGKILFLRRHRVLRAKSISQTADNKPQTANSLSTRRRIDFDWFAGRIILFSL